MAVCGGHQPGPGLLVQLDLDQFPRLVDPLPAGRYGHGEGAVDHVPARPAAAAPQLPLAHPAALAGQRLTGQADQRDGVVVSQPRLGRLFLAGGVSMGG